MSNVHPLVSIIIATYNNEFYIKDSINSVIEQTYTNWEIIIVNDNSNDNTSKILKEITSKISRIVVLEHTVNKGAAVARNYALSKAKGSIIAFLDSDDLWKKEKLEHQINFMNENNAALSFTSYEIIDYKSKKLNQFVDIKIPNKISYKQLLNKEATFGCSTVILNKKLLGDITMPLLRTGQDYATWLKLLKQVEFAHHLPEILTQYRITPGSISRNKFKKASRQWKIYRQVEKLSLMTSILCFINYSRRAIFRR